LTDGVLISWLAGHKIDTQTEYWTKEEQMQLDYNESERQEAQSERHSHAPAACRQQSHMV
jgi:hypothetical protein